MSAGTGVLAQLVSKTQIDDVIEGGGTPEITFFRAASQPYAMFATDWQRLNFATSSPGTDVVETSADVQRSGDMLAHLYLVIKAPAIFNVSSAVCDISGATENARAGTLIKRAYVGSAQHTANGLGRPIWSGTSTDDLQTANTLTGVFPVERIPIGSIMVAKPIPKAAYFATAAAWTDTNAPLAGAALRAEPLVVALTGVSGTVLTWGDSNQVATLHAAGVAAYRIDIFEPPRYALGGGTGALVSVNAPGVRAANLLAAGPQRTNVAINSNIHRMEPVMNQMNFAAFYGTYAPVQMIKSIAIVIGSNTISTLTATVIQAHLEMFTPSDRLMRRMVNASRSQEELCAWALQTNVWYVPIPFWFCASTGYQASLPLVALSFHSISINLALQPYTRAIVNGCGGDMTDRTITLQGDLGTAGTTTLETHAGPKFGNGNTSSLSGLSDGAAAATFASTRAVASANFTIFMLAEYIYLSDTERDLYSDMTDEVLISQWQYATDQSITNSSPLEVTLRFNHPIQCILFGGRLQSNINDHRWGCYEGPVDPLSVSQTLPEGDAQYWLKEAQLKFNNSARTTLHGPEFFHQLMPSVAADRVPDSHIFLQSFSLTSPTSTQIAGTANFSRLDSATLTLTAHGHLFADQSNCGGLNGTAGSGVGQMASGQKVAVEIAACNVNTFKFENGMGGPGFV